MRTGLAGNGDHDDASWIRVVEVDLNDRASGAHVGVGPFGDDWTTR